MKPRVGPGFGHVKSRPVLSYQESLQPDGLFGRRAFFPLQAAHGMDEADDLSRRLAWARILVAGKAGPKVFGFADVEHAVALAAHQIHARAAWRGPEEL